MSLCYTCASSVLSNSVFLSLASLTLNLPPSIFPSFKSIVWYQQKAELFKLCSLSQSSGKKKKNIFELERAEIRVREKLQLMCERTSVACYAEGDRGLRSPGSRASSTLWLLCDIGHVVEPLWTSVSLPAQGGSVATSSLSYLSKVTLSLFEGIWLFGVPESSGKGRAWPRALNLRMWSSSLSDISWKWGHGCHPACSKAYTLNKTHRSKRKSPSCRTLSSYLLYLAPLLTREAWGVLREGGSPPCDFHLELWHIFPRTSSEYLVFRDSQVGLLLLWASFMPFIGLESIDWKHAHMCADSSYELGKRFKDPEMRMTSFSPGDSV